VADENSPRRSTTGQETSDPQPAPRLLIAEDDNLVRALLQRLLSIQGWDVVAVADGVEAVEQWEKHGGFDLAILDVRMPRMNGYDAYLRMKRMSPDARFLFVSGYANQEIETRLVQVEGQPFMAKPFDSDALLSKVSELLGGDAAHSLHAGQRR